MRKGQAVTPEHREKLRQAALAHSASGQPNPMKGRRHSAEARAKMRQARLDFCAQLTPGERKALGIRLHAGKRKAAR